MINGQDRKFNDLVVVMLSPLPQPQINDNPQHKQPPAQKKLVNKKRGELKIQCSSVTYILLNGECITSAVDILLIILQIKYHMNWDGSTGFTDTMAHLGSTR